jgi:hypothetical protein
MSLNNQRAEKRALSLSPLKFQEAVSDLLEVKPEPKKLKQRVKKERDKAV